MFFCSHPKHVVGIQKNCLYETVLLSTQNTCLNEWVRKLLKSYANKISLSGSMEGSLIRANIAFLKLA